MAPLEVVGLMASGPLQPPRPKPQATPRPRPATTQPRRRFTVDEYHRTTKVPRYGRAGVPETWLLNVRDGALEV